MGELAGRVAIVTGASQGIGRGIVLAFADAGASIVAAARSVQKLDETCAEVAARGGQAIPVVCNVQDADDVAGCVARTVQEFGGIDVVVNNAQNIRYLFMMDSSDQDIADAWESGPLATFRFMRLAYPHLKEREGVVVNVGSNSTLLPNTSRYGPYNAAKRAIEALTRTAADEWRSDGVSVFMIHPTAESAMTMNWKAREPEKYAAAVAAMPGGRLGDPELDIGRPLVQLVQRATEFSGKTIHMSAGGVAETVETITQAPISLPERGRSA
jgi:meso-butanediol dehydrogenase / (S,S)-butanediol dehydrogenase / diacetyl reductase